MTVSEDAYDGSWSCWDGIILSTLSYDMVEAVHVVTLKLASVHHALLSIWFSRSD